MNPQSKPRIKLSRVPPPPQRSALQKRLLDQHISRLNEERNVISDEIDAFDDEQWELSHAPHDDYWAMKERRRRWFDIETLKQEKLELLNVKFRERVRLQNIDSNGFRWDDEMPETAHPPGPPFVNPQAYG